MIAAAPPAVPVTCGHQSTATFPARARDLRVGPLVFVGGREYASPEDVAEFEGNKYPAIVIGARRVTVAARRPATLEYANRGAHRVLRFQGCGAKRADSRYDGRGATFWSGFVRTTEPACVRLRIWIDDRAKPRRARIPLGKRC